LNLHPQKISNEAIVKLLCEYKGTESLTTSRGGSRTHLKYLYPNPLCKNPNKFIIFKEGAGWKNPVNHLRSSLASGSITHINNIYQQNFKNTHVLISDIQGFVKDINLPSDKDRAINQSMDSSHCIQESTNIHYRGCWILIILQVRNHSCW